MADLPQGRLGARRLTPTPRRVAALVVLAAGLWATAGAGARPPAGQRYRSALHFHGWSPDSRLVAYTRERWRFPERRGAPPLHTVDVRHRRVRGQKLDGWGPALGRDPAARAAALGYRADALPVVTRTTDVFEFDAPEGRYRFVVAPADRLSWSLWLGDVRLREQPFDRLYVDVAVALHPSPDRRAVAVVLHLGTGWVTDAAIYLAVVPAHAGAGEPAPAKPD